MASRLDHWIRFLPEAGTITNLAGEIEETEMEIIDLAHKVKRLRAQLKRMEKTAHTRARAGWTEADIEEAKAAQIASRAA